MFVFGFLWRVRAFYSCHMCHYIMCPSPCKSSRDFRPHEFVGPKQIIWHIMYTFTCITIILTQFQNQYHAHVQNCLYHQPLLNSWNTTTTLEKFYNFITSIQNLLVTHFDFYYAKMSQKAPKNYHNQFKLMRHYYYCGVKSHPIDLLHWHKSGNRSGKCYLNVPPTFLQWKGGIVHYFEPFWNPPESLFKDFIQNLGPHRRLRYVRYIRRVF